MHRYVRRVLVLAGALLGWSIANAAPPADEAALRQVDERQRQIIQAQDVRGMSELAHQNLRINAPTNQVRSREQLLAMMESGDIAAEDFLRVPEAVTVSGNVGIVMGHESFTPTPNSASGRMFGARPLKRRYTNVYLREAGKWRFLARHANVMAPLPAPSQ